MELFQFENKLMIQHINKSNDNQNKLHQLWELNILTCKFLKIVKK